MGKIYILGLGPGDVDALTLGVVNRIKSGDRNYLRTGNHPTVKYFKDNNIGYESYDYVYENQENFENVYNHIVEDLINKSKEYNTINYLVPGNPMVAEKTVELLLNSEEEDLEIELFTAVSFIETIIELMGIDPIYGLRIVDGVGFKMKDIDINLDSIITQVYNNKVASDIKLILSEVYGDEYQIYLINNGGIEDKEEIHKIPIYELDRIHNIGSLTSIYIPKVDKIDKKLYGMEDIIHTVETLRSEEGCPWDREQTHKSLRGCVIEEAYEVVEAIDNEDIDNLAEELGDLLLQVVLHSQIGLEDGEFNIYDVFTKLNEKMIFRHPHVFSEKKVEKSEEIVYNWNKLKFKDRDISTYTDTLRDIPRLPSLLRSYKVQERAGVVGFDWDSVEGALDKVKEEYYEVVDAIEDFEGGDVEKVEEELGDLLFSVVNVCRFLNVDPEIALNKTVNKFIKRFEIMELKAVEMGIKLENLTLVEMDALWDEAKLHRNER